MKRLSIPALVPLLVACSLGASSDYGYTQPLPEDAVPRLGLLAELAMSRIQSGHVNPFYVAVIQVCGERVARMDLARWQTDRDEPPSVDHQGDCASLLWRMRQCDGAAYSSLSSLGPQTVRAWELIRAPANPKADPACPERAYGMTG